MRLASITILLVLSVPIPAFAHGGRTAADGCHKDNKNGGRHCHGGGQPISTPQRLSGSPTYYANCAAARAAGAAPVREGQRGYGVNLDRDRDGVGCE
jgi:Excalibur calcium-binding domain